MLILLSPSKTMKPQSSSYTPSTPLFLNEAKVLVKQLKKHSIAELATIMNISQSIAAKTHSQFQKFSENRGTQAIFTYTGSVYKHINPKHYTNTEMTFAQNHLRILSGLYGILKPLDNIHPYRLEMQFTKNTWKDILTNTIKNENDTILLNLASKEYSTSFTSKKKTISPVFLNKGKMVTIYTKIARGAMANWVIQKKIRNPKHLKNFSELGYAYSESQSTQETPIFTR